MSAQALRNFAAAIADYPVTMHASLTYIARRADPQSNVIKARLNFHNAGSAMVPRLFVSDQIIAETFAISDLSLKPTDVILSVLSGKIDTPQGEMTFTRQVDGGYAITYVPLHPEPLAQHTRTGVLQIRGTDQGDHWRNTLLDWSLRSAREPYDDLNELALDFGLGNFLERSTIFEAVAGSIVAVNLANEVSGTTAIIGVVASKGLDRSQVEVGYRVLDKGAVVARDTIMGDCLTWIEETSRDVGSTQISVPPAALVNCYARYKGVTYHSAFIADPAITQNPRRSAYERFDPELKSLTDLLNPKDNRRARDVEPAVSWLLWMLGFNTCHLGGTKLLHEGPDIIGMTPEGHFVIVECTVSTLKAESKMHKLLYRTAAVRERLAKSGNSHLRALPVMVTTLSREEVLSEIDDATAHGVYVITADDFPEALVRTMIPPHADRLFSDAEQSLQGGIETLSD